MAQQTINSNSVEPLGGPNLGLSVEQGDGWAAAVTKINAMFSEMYGNTSGIATANCRGAVTALSSNVAAFSSANTNTSQTMMTYTLPASTLVNTGSGLFVETWGTKAANIATISVNLAIGGVALSTGSFSGSGSSWSLDGYYMRTAASAQTAYLEGQQGSTRIANKVQTDTSVETGTITIAVVGTDASAGSADILCNGLLVEFLP